MKPPIGSVLVVDDEADIAELLSLYLRKEGFDVHTALNGDEALKLAETLRPDMILLDVLLGKPDGIEVCRILRTGPCAEVPILFLSCKGEDADIVRGLAEGGDDYMTKPFSPSQLVARVQAHIRRRRQRERLPEETSDTLSCAGLEIDFRKHEVRLNGKLVLLSVKEFELLVTLAKQPTRVFSLEELYRNVWQTDSMGDTRTLMVHISNLRKKIEADPSNPVRIQTVRGFGYRFNPEEKED